MTRQTKTILAIIVVALVGCVIAADFVLTRASPDLFNPSVDVLRRPTPTSPVKPSPPPTAARRTPETTPLPTPTAAPSPTPTRPAASTVQVFVEPEDGRQPILLALRGAQKSIRVVMYLLIDPEIIAALKQAAQRGIDVQVMLEQNVVGEGPGNQDSFKELQAGGVKVNWANPTFRLTHQKTFVIDDQMALILTLNQTRSSFSRNREYGVIDREPAHVADILAAFEADWNRTAPKLQAQDLVWSPVNARSRLINFIDKATQALDVEHQDMQDDQVEDALIQAARRGVRVRVVTSPSENPNRDPNKSGLDKIRRANVQVRFLGSPYIHAKMLVADGQRGFVGSINFTTQSLDFNRELALILTDARAVQRLQSTFDQDWSKAQP